ncbi:lipase family protein [Pontibacter sp. 13R65]|uniref:lipase family protein n=1 Tax=Pontibacter sp. 13R65 TaxID=3127458 RepID=UPI00301D65F3
MMRIFKSNPPTHHLLSILFIISFILFYSHTYARAFQLKPGFNAQECEDIFKLNFAFLDTVKANKFPGFLDGYTIHYRSPSVGLDNSSDIWLREDSTVVIMLRGTTATIQSYLEDFYCAMVPANGFVKLSKNKSFEYQLATDPRAAVHAGFLIGFAYLADDIQPKINELYFKGYRKFLVGGHSQGGALCYYFSAWLMQLRAKGVYKDIIIKSYASAPPKMGNMYFAYDYDNANLSLWSFSIVNTADPVPEIPFTTQQIVIDMNDPNPIINLMKRFNDLPLLESIFFKRAFNKMKKRAEKSSEAYQKYLGKYVGNFIHQSLPEMELPEKVKTTYFARPGVPITLSTNDAYWSYYKKAPKYFHHGIDPYRFLLRQYYQGLAPFEPIAEE